jgi:solute carrier family 35 protein
MHVILNHILLSDWFVWMHVSDDCVWMNGCSLVAAVSYGIASMAMVFINKAILMQYGHSMTLLTLQVLNFSKM